MTKFEALLVVQDLDTRLDQLVHRREGLPERQRIREADQVLATVDGRRSAQESVVGEQRRDLRRIEDEIATLEAKAAAIDTKLYSGEVKAARELQDLQTELEAVRRRISQIEDDDLVALEAFEAAEAELKSIDEMRSMVLEQRSSAEIALTAASAEIDAEIDEVRRHRSDAANGIDEALLYEYGRLRSGLGGVAIARLDGNRCDGCHLTLPAVEVDRIHRAGPDEKVYCDECGRLLVR